MQRLLVAAVSAVSVSVGAHPTVVESPTGAVATSGAMVQDVGIETLGGVFTPLLKRGCKVPCSVTQVFSTGDDGQTEIKISVFRGESKLSKDARALGVYAVVGVPSQPRGMPAVAITFTVLQDRVTLEAQDRNTNRPLVIERRGF